MVTDRSIDILGLADIPLVMDLYNQIYHPPREEAFFARRLEGRRNPLILAAAVDEHPAGFFLGFEHEPDVYHHWIYGVLPDFQGQGLGSRLMAAADAWAEDHGYAASRMECDNRHRRMLHLALAHGYDITGLSWDPDRHGNIIILTKQIRERVESV